MTTGTILDIADRADPLPWWRRTRKVYTALQLAVAALEECRRDQLEHAQKQEYHAAMKRMLTTRENRLMLDVERLSAKSVTPALIDDPQD